MNWPRTIFVTFCGALCLFIFSSSTMAQMTSTNYRIDWDSVGFGGDDSASSTSYRLRDSVGGLGTGDSTSASYIDRGGYRQTYDEVADFTVYIQNSSSQVAATSLVSTTVSVTDESGFSVGDMIAVVQDEGASQVAAIGKVTGTAAGSVTVDAWTGTTPTIDGSGDYAYVLDATAYSFGTLVNTSVATGIVAWEVLADVDDGYGVYVYEDGDLRSGINTITDVADGTVSAGSKEYGARSSDSTLTGSTFDTQDTAFTSSLAVVGSRSSNSYDSRDFLTLKAAIGGTVSSGTYSHTLYFIYVGDY